jgi:hypothetical protein
MRKRGAAAVAGALLLPAVLFMTALIVRRVVPAPGAGAAEGIVQWYAARMWTLWLLLLAMPAAALAVGAVCLADSWTRRERLDVVASAAPTLTAAAILAIVVLHMLAN